MEYQSKRMLRRKELEKKTGLSASTIYTLEKRGEFPKHFMLTPRCAVWDESEVDAFLRERKANPAVGMPGPIPPAVARRASGGV